MCTPTTTPLFSTNPPAMVYFDRPRRVYFRGRHRMTAHLVAEDVEELHDFAERIGHKRRYFQNKPGKPHYDLFDELIDNARAMGAHEVNSREVIQVLRRHHR